MTYLEAATARTDEAAADWNREDWNAAAIGYLKAAELLDRAGPEHATSATNMRARCADAIQKRDRHQ